MLTLLRIIHVRTKQFIWVQCLFSAQYIFYTLSLMYIYAAHYSCNAMWQIVLETACGFSLFPHFPITFPSVVLDFELFNQNITHKMISKKKISTLKNLEVPTCYSKDFNREFRSNLTYFQNNSFRANFKKLFEYNKMCYYFSFFIFF